VVGSRQRLADATEASDGALRLIGPGSRGLCWLVVVLGTSGRDVAGADIRASLDWSMQAGCASRKRVRSVAP
jgi:hypothetical protein